MVEDGLKPAKDADFDAKRSRKDREAAVRRKYDFSVIRTLRQAKGLTIERFAKICGLSYAPISRIETNLIKPNLDTLDKIASGLGMTTYSLVAMAEKRDVEKTIGKNFDAGGFRLIAFAQDGFDVAYGHAARDAKADDLIMEKRDFEVLVVQEGEIEVTVNGERQRVGAGASLAVDRIYARSYRALEDSRLIVIAHSRS